MKTADFDYELPQERIAQSPLEPRDASRLMVLDRGGKGLEHRIFRDIKEYLCPADLLVLNQTRVIPARIFARKPSGGRVEILLLRRIDLLTWDVLVGGKGLVAGRTIIIENGPVAEIVSVEDGPQRKVRFSEPIELFFSEVGNVPLPPYIHKKLDDPERYQTVFSREPGSAAAPTAGLHFTRDLLTEIQEMGVHLAFVTLHVGLDTFAPVTEDDPADHRIHTEWYEIGPDAAGLINQVKQEGGRVIAVGTTSVRVLESAVKRSSGDDCVQPFSGYTDLFITPGYRFQIVDAMITNFHLPRSSLIMLVSAFAGRERIIDAYETAKVHGYRFYSFGDAMLIL